MLFAGALVLQYPIGWLSDRVDRCKLIFGAASLGRGYAGGLRGLVFTFGLGAIAGPLITGWAMQGLGPFAFWLVLGVTFAAIGPDRGRRRSDLDQLMWSPLSWKVTRQGWY